MRSKMSLAVLALALCTLCGTYVYSEAKAPAGPGKKAEAAMKKDFDKMAKELNLTDKQKEQIEAHRKQNMDEMKQIRKQLGEKNRALREELGKQDSDKAKIDQLTADLKELHGKQIQSMVDRVNEMKQILTPEQYKKMGELMDSKMEKTKKKMEKRGMKGGHRMEGPGMEDEPPMKGEGPCMDVPCHGMPL